MTRKLPLAMLALALLLSCKTDIKSTVYVADIHDAMNNESDLYAPSVLGVEDPGDENREKIVELLDRYFSGARNVRKDSVDNSTFLLADIRIPISSTDNPVSIPHIFRFETVGLEDGSIAVEMIMDREAFSSLNEEVKEITYNEIDIANMKISILLNNDTRAKAVIGVSSVYIDGKAHPYAATVELDRRQGVSLRLSDVLKDQFQDTERIRVATLRK